MYYTTLPKVTMPRVSGSKKRHATVVSEAMQKRAEGCAGGVGWTAQERPVNAFEDWHAGAGFEDPTKHGTRRMVMRSDEAARRFQKDLKAQSQHFKSVWMNNLSSQEIYDDRVHFSPYGIRAQKIGERKARELDKRYAKEDPPEVATKKETKRDLFKTYGVDLKGEPNLASLQRLLEDSVPRDRTKKKEPPKSTSDMQALFKGGMFGHNKRKSKSEQAEEDAAEMLTELGMPELFASSKKSLTFM
jgi:hypothetical protein